MFHSLKIWWENHQKETRKRLAMIHLSKGGVNIEPEKNFVRRPAPPEPYRIGNIRSVWEIYVPTMSNEEKPFRLRHHKEWDKQVQKIAGGLTILSPCKGEWIDKTDNVLYNERMIPVRIVCTRNQIIQIMKITERHYNQLDVLAYRISDETIFLSEVK